MSGSVSFTVVTPTLNAERYLRECLSSLQNQYLSGLEHFVIDGGSTDATEPIAREFRDVTFISRPGWNQCRAINDGLRRASGEVVAWLNADDAYVDGAVSFVLTRFAEDAGLNAVIGDCDVIGPDGEHLWWERPGAYDFRRLLQRGNYLAQPSVFLRRGTLERIGYLDEVLEYAMDFDLWLRLRNYEVRYFARPLARFRWHAESKSATNQMRAWREVLRVVRRHGGGWTPHLGWAYVRCLLTLARTGAVKRVSGSTPLRPLMRGQHFFEHG